VIIHSPFNSSTIPEVDFKTLCVNEKISLLPKHPLLTLLTFIAEKRPFKPKKNNLFDNILSQTDLMVDISGLMLSSLTPISASLRYLARIERARRLNIPYIIFPQSIGPFDYPRFWKPLLLCLIKKSFSYVSKVYVRENSSLEILKKLNLSNVELSMDSVFYYPSDSRNKTDINIEIPKMSIALIPNTKLFTYISKVSLLKLYNDLVAQCVKSGFNIFVLYHAAKDKELCEEICQNNNSAKLIDLELDSEQLERILSGFSFIISSRYHSIVNSYKEKVPAVIIGWADKYGDLAHYFLQTEYYLDIRKPFTENDYLDILDKMIRSYPEESKTIMNKLDQLGERNLFQ